MSTNATSSFIELESRPPQGTRKNRGYFFRCRCDPCSKEPAGFRWLKWSSIWNGLPVSDPGQWEPLRRPRGDVNTPGHLRRSLDRFHSSSLQTEDKDADGNLNEAMAAKLEALKYRIQQCHNEQDGDNWWKFAAKYDTSADTSGGTSSAYNADRVQATARGPGLQDFGYDDFGVDQSPDPADDEDDMDYVPSPDVIGPTGICNIHESHRGVERVVEQGDKGEQEDQEEQEEQEEGDDMNEYEDEEEGVEETVEAYPEPESGAQSTAEPMDPGRVKDAFLTELEHIFGQHHVLRLVKAMSAAFSSGLSRSGMDRLGRILTESEDCPKGRSVIPFLNKIRLPTEKNFTCLARHKLYTDKGSTCTTCSEGVQVGNPETQAVDATMQRNSYHLPLPVLFRHYMQQNRFAAAIRSGPDCLQESIRRQEQQQQTNIVRNVWESPAMHDLHQKVGMTCKPTSKRIPVAMQPFTDGVMPTQSHGQDMWVVLFRVLNLPTTLANDYIVPVTIIGSKKKPKSIDVYLDRLVDEMGMSITVPDIFHPGQDLRLELYMFCSAQDGMANPLVMHHQSFPGSYACPQCLVKALRVRDPTAKTQRGGSACPVYDSVDAQGQAFPLKNDDMAMTVNAFCDKATVKNVGTGIYGYKGTPPFAALWANGHYYFGQCTGFVPCVMHLVLNQAKRGWEHALGSSTWTTDGLAKWLQTPEGRQCRDRYGQDIDPAKPPWVANAWPRSNQATGRTGKRDAGLAFEAAVGAKLTTFYHGKLTLFLHKGSKSELSYSRCIKAAEWLDGAITGMLSYLEALAGVDPKIVSARAALYRALKTLCGRHVDVAEIQELDEKMPHIIKRMHDLLPPTERTISLHGFVHLPAMVLRFGPLVCIWSFPFEGYFAFLKPIAQLNTANPSGTGMSRVATQLGLEGWVAAHTPQPEAAPTQNELWRIHPKISALYRGSPVGQEQSIFKSFPGTSAAMLVSAVEEFYESTKFRNPPVHRRVKQSLKDGQVTILYYDRLTAGDVLVQGVDNQCTMRDNGWLILRRTEAGALPRLAHVQAIYRVQVRGKTDGSTVETGIIEERLLLHVAEHRLWEVDDELKQCGLDQFMHMWRCRQTPVHRLIDVSSIDEQAIRAPDPRYPDGNGYHQYVVVDKGTWQNMELKNPFSPSLTIIST